MVQRKTDTDKTYFYEKLASSRRWDDFANNFETARRLRLIFEILSVRSELEGKWFLDAGSGGGHFSQAASSLGAKVVSIDVGLNLLKQVGSRTESRKVVGSVLELPVGKNFFDIVLCTEVIEHTRDPIRAVRELASAVKPGGLLIITVPCRLWNPIVKLATVLRLRPYGGYENFLWPGELRSAVLERGFGVEHLSGFNFCPIFSEKIDFLFNFFDKAYGKKLPWLMVNIFVMARKDR